MLGALIGRNRFAINHLLFADDCILFGDASVDGAHVVRNIINEYEMVSEQQVNFDKFFIYFRATVGCTERDTTTSILGVRVNTNLEKYLSLPMMVRRKKIWAFASFVDRFSGLTVNQLKVYTGVLGASYAFPNLKRSICSARELIFDGLLWRIGSCEAVNIWNDSWMSGPGCSRVSVQNMSTQWTIVNQLIDASSGTWNKEVICRIVDHELLPNLKFMWRLLQNYVPHYSNLNKRRLRIDNVCPLCKEAPEDIDHLLWCCGVLRQLCQSLNLLIDCNRIISNGKNQLVNTFIAADEDTRKLLTISFWGDSNSSTVVVLSCNEEGLIMGACTYSYVKVANAFVAEARACERALLFVIDMGFMRVLLEGDSLTIIKKLSTVNEDRSIFRPISQNIQMLKGYLEEVTYHFVPRNANRAAHALVLEGRTRLSPCFWVE
ncbi:hypothetical protein CXB51_032687 [Gossypium anomalum]|uniref:Reverse transcriptase n=1 Tax=Gossypium anomalum TaxID=47600 RepID=A0A8J5Y2H1_9ROSI|nr:hypothetical protein CXB51_032687 [Gossypium anomalum]